MVRFLTHAYGTFHDGRVLGQVAWPHFDLLWIHSGSAVLQVGPPPTSDVELSAGSGILIYPETYFEGYSGTGLSRVSVQHFDFESETPRRFLPTPLERVCGCKHGFKRFANVDPRIEAEIDCALEWSFERQTPMLHSMRIAQLTIILGRLFEQPRAGSEVAPSQSRIAKVAKMLGRRLTSSVSLDEMAACAGMSTSHFRAEFRRQMGISPGEYHFQLRMREAARLLRTTGQSIKEVALSVGYREVPNFYRAFRNFASTTPTGYRRQHALTG